MDLKVLGLKRGCCHPTFLVMHYTAPNQNKCKILPQQIPNHPHLAFHSLFYWSSKLHVCANQCHPNRACYVLRQKSRCCGSKTPEESGAVRVLVHLLTLPHLKPDPYTRLPTLMPSTVIQHPSKFKWVTWLLLSKAFAMTCTLKSSGEPEPSKTCSTTPARWQRPGKRRPCLFWRSSAPQCRSRSGQLPTPGHAIAVRWIDLMTLFWPFILSSFRRCSSFFTNKEPQWTEPHVFGSGPPLDNVK